MNPRPVTYLPVASQPASFQRRVLLAAELSLLSDAHGHPLNDIRSPADNRAAADFITAQVRAITADPGCALHASIAGGR